MKKIKLDINSAIGVVGIYDDMPDETDDFIEVTNKEYKEFMPIIKKYNKILKLIDERYYKK